MRRPLPHPNTSTTIDIEIFLFFCLVTEVAKMVLAVKASHCHAAIVFGESAQKRAQWG